MTSVWGVTNIRHIHTIQGLKILTNQANEICAIYYTTCVRLTNEKQRPQKGKKEKEKSTLPTNEKQNTQKEKKRKKKAL
jgi:hypothetical protein